jgi:hypothetical protein
MMPDRQCRGLPGFSEAIKRSFVQAERLCIWSVLKKMNKKLFTTAGRGGQAADLMGLAMIVAFLIFGLNLRNLPGAVAEGSSLTEFSSDRAMRHISSIAARPHPIGSIEHGPVRDYIVAELASIGIKAEIQETAVVSHGWNTTLGATVQNVVAKIDGTQGGKAVLLVAHYDSVPIGPGASDDASGVSVILETLRSLKAGAPLKNPVIALFTDGEEAGLFGARAFVAEHPWAKDVGIALNFDARGNSGAVLMFETSDDNGWLIREVSKVTDKPSTSSLMSGIYKGFLNNDTDFTVLKRAGISGLNFAQIEGENSYHTILDSPNKMNTGTLQEQGEVCLGLTRRFGSIDLTNAKSEDAIFFNGPGNWLIYYSRSWGTYLCVFASLVLGLMLTIGFKKWGLKRSEIALSAAALFVGAILSLMASRVLVWMALRGRGMEGRFLLNFEEGLYDLGFIALALAIVSGVYVLVRKKVSLVNMFFGALILWWLMMLTVTLALPSASYFFTWPLIFGLIGVLASQLGERAPGWIKTVIVLLFSIIPAVAVFTPLTHLVLEGVGLSLSSFIIGMIALFFGLLLPQLEVVTRAPLASRHWTMSYVSLFLALGLILYAFVRTTKSERHPLPNTIFYVWDASKGKSLWASIDQKPDEYTLQFFSNSPDRGTLDEYLPLNYGYYLKANAPLAPLQPPAAELVSDQRSGDTRTVGLLVKSLRQAPALSVYLDSNTRVLEAAVNDKRVADNDLGGNDPTSRWGLNYSNPGKDGVRLTLKVSGAGPLNVSVVDQSYELPQLPDISLKPRPKSFIPSRFPLTDSTIISKTFSF